ncbi:MAG: methyltransferase domain-containing protein [Anaerolineales bacterium]|nr:methyltransferase domain-containing protein [Anaerolineales bacterium]
MNHQDHVGLIQDGIHKQQGVWADFGSGRGAFTLALADLLEPPAEIYSIDQDRSSLTQQRAVLNKQFPLIKVHYQQVDFRKRIDLPPLDGLVIANALHFVPDKFKGPMLKMLHDYLKPSGRLIMVEYNVDHGNHWVPYPFSFQRWTQMAAKSGFGETRLLATRPSRFLGEIYAAVSVKGS